MKLLRDLTLPYCTQCNVYKQAQPLKFSASTKHVFVSTKTTAWPDYSKVKPDQNLPFIRTELIDSYFLYKTS